MKRLGAVAIASVAAIFGSECSPQVKIDIGQLVVAHQDACWMDWSIDDATLYWEAPNETSHYTLHAVDVQTGSVYSVIDGHDDADSPKLVAGDSMLFFMADRTAAGSQLFQASFAGGRAGTAVPIATNQQLDDGFDGKLDRHLECEYHGHGIDLRGYAVQRLLRAPGDGSRVQRRLPRCPYGRGLDGTRRDRLPRKDDLLGGSAVGEDDRGRYDRTGRNGRKRRSIDEWNRPHLGYSLLPTVPVSRRGRRQLRGGGNLLHDRRWNPGRRYNVPH
jgi:hypothetical protein